MTDLINDDGPGRPRVRLAPGVRRQIDAAWSDSISFGVDRDTRNPISDHINDQVASLARSQSRWRRWRSRQATSWGRRSSRRSSARTSTG